MDTLAGRLRSFARERLPDARYLHTLGVEKEAVTLAVLYGADPEQARYAALLHDITKPEQNQLKLCEKYGIIPPAFEREMPKLLHALTAEAVAKEWALPTPTLSAIRWHTTGRAGMSALEKIIYLADYIEPFRSPFEGLEELRRLAYRHLDRAMVFGLRLTVETQRGMGRALHPATGDAICDLQKNCEDE